MGPGASRFFILPAGWWRASFNGTPIRVPPYLRSVPREPSRVSWERTLYSSRTRIVVMVPILFYPLFFEIHAVLYLLLWALTQFYSGTMALPNRAQAWLKGYTPRAP